MGIDAFYKGLKILRKYGYGTVHASGGTIYVKTSRLYLKERHKEAMKYLYWVWDDGMFCWKFET